MDKRIIPFLGSLGIALTAQAQLTVNNPTTASLYDPVSITMLPGFSTSTSGFEARIKLVPAAGGTWSKPRPWTPLAPNPSAGRPDSGMIGIHTHVLPNGKVLFWEGHNDNEVNDHLSHAYVWNPDPNATLSHLTYPNVYEHVDNPYSNIFCSGHAFLPDGKLLVVGGHFSDGSKIPDPAVLPFVPSSALGAGYIGLADINLFDYSQISTLKPYLYWKSSVDTYPLIRAQAISFRRWYPTATTLANGDVLVVTGQQHGYKSGPGTQSVEVNAETPEV